MRQILSTVALLMLLLPVSGQERKMIYVDKMEGLETFVEKALRDAELPFDFIQETQRPDLKANLNKMQSAYAEVLYQHKFGRNETHRLELRDVSRNKVIATHNFALKNDEESKNKLPSSLPLR